MIGGAGRGATRSSSPGGGASPASQPARRPARGVAGRRSGRRAEAAAAGRPRRRRARGRRGSGRATIETPSGPVDAGLTPRRRRAMVVRGRVAIHHAPSGAARSTHPRRAMDVEHRGLGGRASAARRAVGRGDPAASSRARRSRRSTRHGCWRPTSGSRSSHGRRRARSTGRPRGSSPRRSSSVSPTPFADPTVSASGWECAVDAQRRIVAALADLLVDERAGDIAVVGHGGVGTFWYCHLAGVPIDRRRDQPGQGHHFTVDRSTGRPLHAWRPITGDRSRMPPRRSSAP